MTRCPRALQLQRRGYPGQMREDRYRVLRDILVPSAGQRCRMRTWGSSRSSGGRSCSRPASPPFVASGDTPPHPLFSLLLVVSSWGRKAMPPHERPRAEWIGSLDQSRREAYGPVVDSLPTVRPDKDWFPGIRHVEDILARRTGCGSSSTRHTRPR